MFDSQDIFSRLLDFIKQKSIVFVVKNLLAKWS